MQKKRFFSFRERARSFGFAWNGLGAFLRSEPNAWIHLAATIIVAAGVFILRPERWEIVLLVCCVGWVWFAEIMNTCLEKLLDLLHPDQHPVVKKIKDMSAAAVLILSVVAFLCGLLIFIPLLLHRLG